MKDLSEELCALIQELRADREQRKHQFDWERSHQGIATKNDLLITERRIIEAIRTPHDLPEDEVQLLDAILARSHRTVRKLEALDRKT